MEQEFPPYGLYVRKRDIIRSEENKENRLQSTDTRVSTMWYLRPKPVARPDS